MTEYYIVWHDVEDYEPRRTFELITVPPQKLSAEDKAVPSMAGFKTIYIRWHRRQLSEDQVYLVTYTHQQLTDQEVEDLLEQATRFVQGQEELEEPLLPYPAGQPLKNRWQPGTRISTHELGSLYTVEVGDDLTHQVLLLTPIELVKLRNLLNGLDIPELDDPVQDREAGRLKALVLYNGRALPVINRTRYEAQNLLALKFHFEIIQVSGDDRRKVGEL
jgi:hypothetical protein